MTKHERVVETIRNEISADELCVTDAAVWEQIADILSREYGDVRAKAFEEAAVRFERLIETLQLPETPQYDGDERHIERRVITALVKAIRAMKEADDGSN